MNKTAIKNFAVWARKKLIADITYKAGLMGISEAGIKPALPQSTKDTEFYDIGIREPYSISGDAVNQHRRLAELINEKAASSDYKTAFCSVMEDVAYTWFNRLIAIRFMEVNDYLPSHIRVLSSESRAKLEPDLVTTPFDAELDLSQSKKDRILWLKSNSSIENDKELFILLFIKQCNSIKGRDGKGLPNTSLNRIIKNVMYTGIIQNGESQSQYMDELRIIDDEVFAHAQEIMQQRTQPHSPIPLNCKGKSLLVGNIYCAHCGNRLTLTTSGRLKRMPDGTTQKEVRARYQCHYNVRHPGECDGQSGYSVPKVDAIVEEVICMQFSEITAASESKILSCQHEKEIELARTKLEMSKDHLQQKGKDLKDYKNETLKVIRGQSKLSIDLLNTLVADTEAQLLDAQAEIDAAEQSYRELLESAENLREEYDRLLSWADLYGKSTFEAKKMIVAQFIKAVRVGRDYNIEIDFNVSFEEFQSFCVKDPESKSLQARESQTA